MTTEHDDDQGAVPEVLVTVAEAHAVLKCLPTSGREGAVPDLLRAIIAAGRDTRLRLDPLRPLMQYATVEGLAAAAGGARPRPGFPCVGQWSAPHQDGTCEHFWPETAGGAR